MKYIPQAPPFEMIDQLLNANPTESHSQLAIQEDNIFVENGYLTEPGLIENMAQTAAAGIGYLAFSDGATESPIGFIGQIKNLKIYWLPKVGQRITTHVSVQNALLNVRVLTASIHLEENIIATTEMKVFLQENNSRP